MLTREFTGDIGAELPEDVRSHISAYPDAEPGSGIVEVAFVGIVSHRDRDCGGISGDFREIELPLAGVTVRQEGLACRIYQSRPITSGSAAKITRVLVQDRRENRLRHVVSDYEVS